MIQRCGAVVEEDDANRIKLFGFGGEKLPWAFDCLIAPAAVCEVQPRL
jgi:hypothetical protein